MTGESKCGGAGLAGSWGNASSEPVRETKHLVTQLGLMVFVCHYASPRKSLYSLRAPVSTGRQRAGWEGKETLQEEGRLGLFVLDDDAQVIIGSYSSMSLSCSLGLSGCPCSSSKHSEQIRPFFFFWKLLKFMFYSVQRETGCVCVGGEDG